MTLSEDSFEIDWDTKTIIPISSETGYQLEELIAFLSGLWSQDAQMDIDVKIICLPACIPTSETV